MAINITSPVTGAAITGLTTPTYSVAADGSAGVDVTKSYYVSAVGGTQPGVGIHSISSPFTVSWKNPKSLATPGVPDSTGVLRTPSRRNTYHLTTRKGGKPVANQADRLNMIKTSFEVEAGVETTDPNQVRAMLSLHIGALQQQMNGIVDTLITGAP